VRHVRHGLPDAGAAALLALSACHGDDPRPEVVAFSEIREEILLPSCGFASCHGSGAGDLTIDAEGAWDALVEVPSAVAPDEILVIPGDPDGSYLVKKLEGDPGIVGLQMPQGGQLPESDLDAIRDWIARGAPSD
jgi:hypothetical protein